MSAHKDYPIDGYYRIKLTDIGTGRDRFVPIRYKYSGDFDDLQCFIDGKRVEHERALWEWPQASANRVTEEAYRNALNGHPWPDVDATVHAAEAGIGNNNPPTDPAELFAEMIKSASAGASDYAKIESDEVAARAQTLRSRLIELSGQADKVRVAEREPHKTAAEAVDAKWQPIVKAAKTAADAIRAAMAAWETIKWQKQQAAEKAAQEALAKYNSERLSELPAPPLAPVAPSKIKGGSGRAASVATITQVQSVSDWSALAVYLCLQPDVQDALMKVANRMLKSDTAAKIPGVVTQQVRNVK